MKIVVTEEEEGSVVSESAHIWSGVEGIWKEIKRMQMLRLE